MLLHPAQAWNEIESREDGETMISESDVKRFRRYHFTEKKEGWGVVRLILIIRVRNITPQK